VESFYEGMGGVGGWGGAYVGTLAYRLRWLSVKLGGD
jgi:hypothetical protein